MLVRGRCLVGKLRTLPTYPGTLSLQHLGKLLSIASAETVSVLAGYMLNQEWNYLEQAQSIRSSERLV
jgi:putative flippase GtrA